MALSVMDILKVDDLKREEVKVDEWGGSVWVRMMTAAERSEIERIGAKKNPADDPGGFRSLLLQKTLCKEDGSPLATADEMKQLMTKSAAAIETLFEKAAELNAFREKDVKELEKNLEDSPPEK